MARVATQTALSSPLTKDVMTPEECRTLFLLARKFQMHKTVTDSKLYRACDMLLDDLWPYYHTQNKEQQR